MGWGVLVKGALNFLSPDWVITLLIARYQEDRRCVSLNQKHALIIRVAPFSDGVALAKGALNFLFSFDCIPGIGATRIRDDDLLRVIDAFRVTHYPNM